VFRRTFIVGLIAAATISCAGPVGRMPREVVAKIPLIDFHAHYPGRPPRTAQDFIRTMDSVGIERTVLFLGGTGSKEASGLAKYSDRFALFFAGPAANDAVRAKIKTGDPKAVEDLIADYERALKSGLYRGLGEIYAYHAERPTRLAPDSPAIGGLLELAAKYGVPVTIHCTADGRPEMERALKAHLKTTVIWAHAGSFLSPAAMTELLQAHPNLYFELAIKNKRVRSDKYPILSGLTLREDWRRLFESYPDRFLLGFDFPGTGPNHGTPLESAAESAEFFRTVLMQLNPSTAHKIAHQNGRAILAGKRVSGSMP
jgi:predicted TIM-barrel fold metal-dependent hydrolase